MVITTTKDHSDVAGVTILAFCIILSSSQVISSCFDAVLFHWLHAGTSWDTSKKWRIEIFSGVESYKKNTTTSDVLIASFVSVANSSGPCFSFSLKSAAAKILFCSAEPPFRPWSSLILRLIVPINRLCYFSFSRDEILPLDWDVNLLLSVPWLDAHGWEYFDNIEMTTLRPKHSMWTYFALKACTSPRHTKVGRPLITLKGLLSKIMESISACKSKKKCDYLKEFLQRWTYHQLQNVSTLNVVLGFSKIFSTTCGKIMLHVTPVFITTKRWT